MNKQELIEYCESLKGDLNKFINGIDVNKIVKKIEQLDEPQKPVVPQFVADWIEVCKEHLTSSLYLAMTPSFLKANNQGIELTIWIKKNEETFARTWLDGYEVEQEKRYLVKMKNLRALFCYLAYIPDEGYWSLMASGGESIIIKHTRKELEEAGFGEVFDSPLFEVEEVTE
nr:MAG TPA: Protein of unknown function (DUF1642) [Caudoviricetes sp.]